MEGEHERLCTLAFARLLGHLLSDGPISAAGQARMNPGQALDREAMLNDVGLLTGKRPAATRYDERKWSIVLPLELTRLVRALPGVRVGRRIDQPPQLPAFVVHDDCPVAVVREFLGGLFGADGHAPTLHRWGKADHEASLHPPAYSQSAKPEFLEDTKEVMREIVRLLVRCGVKARGAVIREYPTRHSSSSYPVARDGVPRTEIRLELPEGLSFIERVGFRYCVEKESLSLPGFSLTVVDRRPAGIRAVFDIAVDEVHAFIAAGTSVHNCIGNSGPLKPEISAAVKAGDLTACSVLSGNRNFEGRVHPETRMNFLASPPLVVAYALAGTLDVDLTTEPLGTGSDGKPVYLKDIWPSDAEVQALLLRSIDSQMFRSSYANVFKGDENWTGIPVPAGQRYAWDAGSTYVKSPPYFDAMSMTPPALEDVRGARVLALLGDSVTTDHISPAGNIARNSPAARYLVEHGVEPKDFNSYGARRGNHEVMMRGTFANIRLRNLLVPGVEGGVSVHLPDGEQASIYDVAMRYRKEGTPLVVLAGREYGTGSSRDWAAKGAMLLGVKAVIAESFERIHRSNLIGMGVAPLQFLPGQNASSLGLTGREVYTIAGLSRGDAAEVTVTATPQPGKPVKFTARLRIDTPKEREYYRHGGILQYVLRQLATAGSAA